MLNLFPISKKPIEIDFIIFGNIEKFLAKNLPSNVNFLLRILSILWSLNLHWQFVNIYHTRSIVYKNSRLGVKKYLFLSISLYKNKTHNHLLNILVL